MVQRYLPEWKKRSRRHVEPAPNLCAVLWRLRYFLPPRNVAEGLEDAPLLNVPASLPPGFKAGRPNGEGAFWELSSCDSSHSFFCQNSIPIKRVLPLLTGMVFSAPLPH